MSTDSQSCLIFLSIPFVFICAFIGHWIGKRKERSEDGFLLGLLLGPLGWLIGAVALDYPKKCPMCLKGVPSSAVKCCHCGSDLPASTVAPTSAPSSFQPIRTLDIQFSKPVRPPVLSKCPTCNGAIRFDSFHPGNFQCPHCSSKIVVRRPCNAD